MSDEPRVPLGAHPYRIRPEADNALEIAFFEQWKEEHELHDLITMITMIPFGESSHTLPFGELNQRDRMLVSTIIQWLGSQVGLSFITMALERTGCSVVKQDKKGIVPVESFPEWNKSHMADTLRMAYLYMLDHGVMYPDGTQCSGTRQSSAEETELGHRLAKYGRLVKQKQT